MKEQLKEHLRRKLFENILNEAQDVYEPPGYLSPGMEPEESPTGLPRPFVNPFTNPFPYPTVHTLQQYGIDQGLLQWLQENKPDEYNQIYQNFWYYILRGDKMGLLKYIQDLLYNGPRYNR